MRATRKAYRNLGIGLIQRDINTGGFESINAVIGQVLVPGSSALRAGGLDEGMIVKELCIAALHQLARHRGCAGMSDEIQILRD